jgi:hypothetical protein
LQPAWITQPGTKTLSVFTEAWSPKESQDQHFQTLTMDPDMVIFAVDSKKKLLPYRPGDKKQLKAQDVTAKLVRSNILRKVPKNILFCIKHT